MDGGRKVGYRVAIHMQPRNALCDADPPLLVAAHVAVDVSQDHQATAAANRFFCSTLHSAPGMTPDDDKRLRSAAFYRHD